MSYIARGDASGLGAHDRSWRQLALHGNTSAAAAAGSIGGTGRDTTLPSELDGGDDLEAFTPAFQFSAFRFVQITYDWPILAATPFPALDAASLACFRIGAGFDWTGDVAVAGDGGGGGGGVTLPHGHDGGTRASAAQRFNTVVAATRSTAISNYLMDVPTDCPRECHPASPLFPSQPS
jgi:hypothetical protein